MRFVSFTAQGRKSWGVATAGGVHDLGARLGAVIPDLKTFLAARALGPRRSAGRNERGRLRAGRVHL